MKYGSILQKTIDKSMPLTIKGHYQRRGTFQQISFFGADDNKIVVERDSLVDTGETVADEWEWLPNPKKGETRADKTIDNRDFKWTMTVEAAPLEESPEEAEVG